LFSGKGTLTNEAFGYFGEFTKPWSADDIHAHGAYAWDCLLQKFNAGNYTTYDKSRVLNKLKKR
jgi:hypothetical protein